MQRRWTISPWSHWKKGRLKSEALFSGMSAENRVIIATPCPSIADWSYRQKAKFTNPRHGYRGLARIWTKDTNDTIRVQ